MELKIDDNKLWSIEAEAAVLGSMIIDPPCISNILPLLDEKAFFKPEHQTIYNALITLFVARAPIDAILLRTELKAINKLDEVGDVEYIGKLMESVPSSASAVYYAKVVNDCQRYRRIIEAVDKINHIPNKPIPISEQIQQIQSLAMELETGQTKTDFFTFKDQIEKVAEGNQSDNVMHETGLIAIDNIIGGVSDGELVIVAGRPSMGKSALALQFALNMANRGLSIIFITLEMAHRALMERALRNQQAADLKKLDIVLHEKTNTPEKQIAFIRARKQTHKVDVVFIDYLQLMSDGRKNDNRVQEISAISRKLKLAAMNEGVPIVALSQLNRQVEQREKHRPRLSDLRESGSIEQDADIVMLLSREDYYRRSENPEASQDGIAEVFIAKNRRGSTGIAQLMFLDKKVTFGDVAHI